MILRRFLSVAWALAGLGLFAGLLYASGPERVWRELQAVGGLGFLAVVANVALSFLAWTLSWFLLLRAAGIPIPWSRILSPMLAASAVTYLTPSAFVGGEPVRVLWVARATDTSTARVAATVLVERLLAGISLLGFVAIGGVFALLSPAGSVADKGAVALGLGLMALFWALGVWSFARRWHWLSRALRRLARWIPGRGRLLRLAASAADMETQIHALFAKQRGPALAALFLQVLAVYLTYIRPQLFFYFTRQALFTFPQLSLFFTLNVFIGAFLWLTPGGFGLADGGRAGVFQLLGIPVPSAFAYNVLFRAVELIQAGLGFYLLLRNGFPWKRAEPRPVSVEEGKPQGYDT